MANLKENLSISSIVTIVDNASVLVEDCKQVIECNEICAKIATTKYEIEIWGNNLTMNNYNLKSVEVLGTIATVNIMPKRIKV
ncbi:MAG: YabP/YqfC family sporulation protein [Oscillospiraceae bacterium]